MGPKMIGTVIGVWIFAEAAWNGIPRKQEIINISYRLHLCDTIVLLCVTIGRLV